MKYVVWVTWVLFMLTLLFAAIGTISMLAFPTTPIGVFFLTNGWLPVALQTLPRVLALSYPVAASGAFLGLSAGLWHRFFRSSDLIPDVPAFPKTASSSESSFVDVPIDSPDTQTTKEFAKKYGIRVSDKSAKKDMEEIANMLDTRELIQKSWRIYSPYHRIKLARIEKQLDEANLHQAREIDYTPS